MIGQPCLLPSPSFFILTWFFIIYALGRNSILSSESMRYTSAITCSKSSYCNTLKSTQHKWHCLSCSLNKNGYVRQRICFHAESSEAFLTEVSRRSHWEAVMAAGRVFIHSGICSQCWAHHCTPNYPQVHEQLWAFMWHNASCACHTGASVDNSSWWCFSNDNNTVAAQPIDPSINCMLLSLWWFIVVS